MYKKYNPNPRRNEHAGDCVIRAIAKATGKTWETIFVELSLAGFFSGDWGNSNNIWDAYLRDLGFKRAIIPNSCPNCFTVDDFTKEFPNGAFILGTGKHAVAVVDGDYYDTWDSGAEIPIYYYTEE